MELFLTFLWKSALIITLFYSFYKLFLHKETYFQSIRYFLLAGIVIAFILPFIIIPIYIDTEPIQLSQITNNTITNFSSANTPKSSLNLVTVLFYSYFAITAIFLIRFIVQLLSIATIILKNKSVKIGYYYYIETDGETSPLSFFNFIIYNPLQFSQRELAQILAHEKVHVIQKHSLDTLLSNLLIITQWYNPVSWLYKKNIEQNLEFIADELAQKSSNSNQSYQQLLLKTGISNYQMALTNSFYNSLLKKRIIMLHTKRSNNKSQWKIALIAPFLIAFLFIFNTKVIAQQKNSNKKFVKINVEVYVMGISKESSKEDLKEITKVFKDKGLKVKFSGIKRNGNNEITAIKIDAEADNGKASAAFATNDNKGINPIQISFDNENNNLSIGSTNRSHGSDYLFSDKAHGKIVKHKIHKKGDHIFTYSNNDTNSSTKVWVNKDGDTTRIKKMIIDIDEDYNGEGIHEIIIDDEEGTETEIIKIKSKKGDGKGNFVFISEDDDDDENTVTTYKVNGKKMSKAEFRKFDKNKIKTIEIKKEVTKKK